MMADEVRLHVVRKAQLAAGKLPPEWEDSEGLTVPSSRIRRMLLNNPLSKSDDDPVQVRNTAGDRVAGRLNVIVGELMVRGRPVPVVWGADLLVSPVFRGRGLATQLVECWQGLNHTVAGCGANQAAQRIYRKLAWVLFRSPTYQLVRHSRKFVEGVLRSRLAAAALAPPLDALLRLRRGLVGRPLRRHIEHLRAERVEQMSAEFDPLLAQQPRPVTAHRSAAWINWLLTSPGPEEQRDQRLYYVRDARREVVAYFMIRRRCFPLLGQRFKDVMVGSVKDWLIFDDEKADTLAIILLGFRELLSWKVDVLISLVPDAEDARVVRRLGAAPRKGLTTVFHADPTSPLAENEYRLQENWRLSSSNGDGFYN